VSLDIVHRLVFVARHFETAFRILLQGKYCMLVLTGVHFILDVLHVCLWV
jgi:hypothetical protein